MNKLVDVSPEFVCPVCSKKYFTLRAFHEHGFATHAVCFVCGKWFADAPEFNEHFMQKHILHWREGIWAGVSCNCGQCRKEIASIKEMNDSAFDYKKDMEIVNRVRIHMQQNHFLCPICRSDDRKWIKTEQGWKRHITLKHKE